MHAPLNYNDRSLPTTKVPILVSPCFETQRNRDRRWSAQRGENPETVGCKTIMQAKQDESFQCAISKSWEQRTECEVVE
jgi:hypothetical protein